MKRILRRVVLASLTLTATGAIGVYARSEAIRRRRYAPVPESLPPAPLALVAAYDSERFRRLLRTGTPRGDGPYLSRADSRNRVEYSC